MKAFFNNLLERFTSRTFWIVIVFGALFMAAKQYSDAMYLAIAYIFGEKTVNAVAKTGAAKKMGMNPSADYKVAQTALDAADSETSGEIFTGAAAIRTFNQKETSKEADS